MNPRITLTPLQIEVATLIGTRRHEECVRRGMKGRNGQRKEAALQNDIDGAIGELAVSLFLNVALPMSINTFQSEPDLFPCIEVKWRSSHNYDLLIRKHENLSQVFVLVTGKAPHLWVRGWAIGRDVALPKYLAAHGGRDEAYFPPVSVLSQDWTELRKTYLWQ